MPESARITSVEALESFRSSLIIYLEKAIRAEIELPSLAEALHFVHRPPPDADTALLAASLVGKEASINALCVGSGISFVTILVIMPSVPSEPIISLVRS